MLQLLAETKPDIARENFGAFYSSVLGGIVTEPGFMVVSIDDHMVHKGDAVYESVELSEGYLYRLDDRLQRFMESAELAGIPLPFSEDRLRRVLLDTAASSLKMNGKQRGVGQCWCSNINSHHQQQHCCCHHDDGVCGCVAAVPQ